MKQKTLLKEIESASNFELDQYLLGAMCDSTFSQLHGTIRFCQKDWSWLIVLKEILARLGHNSWIYKEGKSRTLWVCETKTYRPKVLEGNSLAYARGFFDADGGMPSSINSRLYFQFAQKSWDDVVRIKSILEDHDINCGSPHIPSLKIDPDYWRLFVSSKSHKSFMYYVSSWHPGKRLLMEYRKIK